MPSHRQHVENMLRDAADAHTKLLAQLPDELVASLPVDAQGLTRAIDYLADRAGLTPEERRALVSPHAVNPAVMHARVYGRAPLSPETVIASFVEGARVRADALAVLGDHVGGESLGEQVRQLLIAHPPPVRADDQGATRALHATYAAHEQAALLVAAGLDDLT